MSGKGKQSRANGWKRLLASVLVLLLCVGILPNALAAPAADVSLEVAETAAGIVASADGVPSDAKLVLGLCDTEGVLVKTTVKKLPAGGGGTAALEFDKKAFAGHSYSAFLLDAESYLPLCEEKGGRLMLDVAQYIMTATASSQEESAAVNTAGLAIDGSAETIWHTRWSAPAATAPHFIQLDMGRVLTVGGLRYLPRQDGNSNGRIRGYNIYVSTDGVEFEQIASGSWDNDATEKFAYFTLIPARYLKLEVPSGSYASCAELNVLTDDYTWSALWSAIADAKKVLAESEVGEDAGQYPQSAVDDLAAAVDLAVEHAKDASLSDEQQLEIVVQGLLASLQTFYNAVSRHTLEELTALIQESKQLNAATSVGQGVGQVDSQEVKSEFKRAIARAEQVQSGTPGDNGAVHTAYRELAKAKEVFQEYIRMELKSLAGEWQLKLGPYAAGQDELGDVCRLPATLDENRKGSPNNGVNINKLNRKYTYTGQAVYQKQVYIPQGWEGKAVTFLMERTKNTRVWVNDVEQTDYSSNDTLGTAQEYYLTGLLPGQMNKLTVEVLNSNYQVGTGGHQLTDETVTNWNGILGRIELRAADPVWIQDVLVYPDIHAKTATVKMTVAKESNEAVSGTLTFRAESKNHEGSPVTSPQGETAYTMDAGENRKEIVYTYALGDQVKLWSEFDPALYTLSVSLTSGGYHDQFETTFGMREFKADGRKFAINGVKTFMRGEGNSAVFPLTGYAYMTKEEWLDFFGKAQELGINMFRFHSWTPPEAAFDAADELGIYMQPELYGFGGNPFNAYYTAEAGRILKYLANHPSFVFFAWGNELDTASADKRAKANELREYCRSVDSTRLYAEGSNNNYWNVSLNAGDDYWTTCKTVTGPDDKHIRMSFSWSDAKSGGALESQQPNSSHTYDKALAGYNVPIMNHEAGQYQVLPYFDAEIPKYDKGIFEARNLMAFRERMRAEGILNKNEVYSQSTARSSAIMYRADLEAALKSNDLAGYQLLSIQDFPGQGTAHVGILDNFMEDKPGGFTKAEYKNFNQETVVLANLPKYIYQSNETFTADAVLVNYSPAAIEDVTVKWSIKKLDGTVVDAGTLQPLDVPQGGVTNLGSLSSNAFSGIDKAQKLIFEVEAEAIGNANRYDIWVYPAALDVTAPSGVYVTRVPDKAAMEVLEQGGKVLLLPEPNKTALPNSVSVRWTNDYWSKMFHNYSNDNAYTMGIYALEDHPVFRNFPTEYHNNYQWFNLLKGSRAIRLTDAPAELEPMVQNIDHMDRAYRLGSLFEAKVKNGSLLVCTFDLPAQMNTYPEAKQLYRSILDYMASSDFKPTVPLTEEYVTTIVNAKGEGVDAYSKMEAESYNAAKAKTSGSYKLENGTDASGAAAVAVGGIASNDWLKFSNVDFGTGGSKQITVVGANANAAPAVLEVRLGSHTGTLLATLNFVKSSDSWSKYLPQTFDLPVLTGKHDIVFVSKNASFAFESFSFVKSGVAYTNPFGLEPENCPKIENIEGTSSVLQLYVIVDGSVRFSWDNCNFGVDAIEKIALHGSTDQPYVDAVLEYQADGQAKTHPLRFVRDEGAEYALSSETYFIQSFDVPDLKGVQNITLTFQPGTKFSFEYLDFIRRSAYTRVNARTFDRSEPAVNLERSAPNQVVGGFNPGGSLTFKDVSFGIKGASKLTILAANASTYAEYCKLRIWVGPMQYFDVSFPQTGGWGADFDRAVEFNVPLSVTGKRDVRIEMLEGGLAFHAFWFTENETAERTAAFGVGLAAQPMSKKLAVSGEANASVTATVTSDASTRTVRVAGQVTDSTHRWASVIVMSPGFTGSVEELLDDPSLIRGLRQVDVSSGSFDLLLPLASVEEGEYRLYVNGGSFVERFTFQTASAYLTGPEEVIKNEVFELTLHSNEAYDKLTVSRC